MSGKKLLCVFFLKNTLKTILSQHLVPFAAAPTEAPAMYVVGKGGGTFAHVFLETEILNSSRLEHVQGSTWNVCLFCHWPDSVWCLCAPEVEGLLAPAGYFLGTGGAQTPCWVQGVPRPCWLCPLCWQPPWELCGGSAGEGARVGSLTLLRGLASSDLCHVNCQDWEGGSRFHRGQWKRSNEFPLCFTAWQTSTYCHFA